MADRRLIWAEAFERAFQQNRGTSRPSSVRALAVALAAANPDGPTAESWRRTLARVKRGQVVEEQAVVIAATLAVPRSALPAVEKPSLRLILARLEELEDGVSRLLDGQGEILRRMRGDAAQSLRADVPKT